jgi:hypothetical protein
MPTTSGDSRYRINNSYNLPQPSSGGGSGGFPIVGISPTQIPPSVQPAGSRGPGPSAPGGVGFSIGSGNKPFAQRNENVQKKAKGGKVDMAQDKSTIKKAFKQHDAQKHKGSKGTNLKLAKGGAASKRADGCCNKGKTKGRFM